MGRIQLIKTPLLLWLQTRIKDHGVIKRISKHPAVVSAALWWGRSKARDHPIWHKIAAVQTTFVQWLRPAVLLIVLVLLKQV
jgi:hypothetical protein